MKLFLDSADLAEIESCAASGLLDGVTTNPSLIAKSGEDLTRVVSTIGRMVDGPVSAEVIETEYEAMSEEAVRLAEIHENVVVKVPLTEDGLKTVAHLAPRGICFNVTLCFSLVQALLAAKAGATFVSPFVGRWDDIDMHGIDLIPDMVQVFDHYGFETEILVASVRGPLHVSQAALAGAHAATVPYKVFKQLFRHPLTDIGLERFLADYHASQKKDS